MADYVDFFGRYAMGIIQMLAGFYFFTGFLKKKVTWMDYLLFAVVGIAIMTVARGGSIEELLAYILLLTAGGIFCPIAACGRDALRCRTGGVSAVLYAVLTAEIMQLCYGIFDSVLCILYPWMSPFNQEMVGIAFMALGNTALFAAAFCCRIMDRYFPYSGAGNHQYALMILTPALMIFLMGKYISSAIYGNTIDTDGGGNIANINHYQLLAVQLLGMASLFCIMFAYRKLLENFCLSTELSLLEQEEHFLNQYVEEAKERYEKTRSFRHDIKNHISVVKELLWSGKTEQALSYIGDMEGMTRELSFPCSTNNPVTDILVGSKLAIAKSMGIDTACSLVLPYPCLVRDIDFCIILSNALDNAIHACQRMGQDADKYIRVTGHVQGDFILLEIENSVQGRETFRKGTGLSNVNAVAEKYQGAMNVQMQDAAFVLSVLLIIPQHSEGIPRQNG